MESPLNVLTIKSLWIGHLSNSFLSYTLFSTFRDYNIYPLLFIRKAFEPCRFNYQSDSHSFIFWIISNLLILILHYPCSVHAFAIDIDSCATIQTHECLVRRAGGCGPLESLLPRLESLSSIENVSVLTYSWLREYQSGETWERIVLLYRPWLNS